MPTKGSKAGKKRKNGDRYGRGCVYRPTYKTVNGKRKESSIWWIAYSVNGEQRYESSHSNDRMDAVRLLNSRLAARNHHFIDPRAEERLRFNDLLQMIETDYAVNGRKSGSRARVASRALAQFFSEYRAIAISTDRIMEFIRWRQETGVKLSTIAYDLAILKRMFTLAVRAEKLSKRPYIPALKVNNVRTGFFTESEFRAVLAHLPEDLRSVVECLFLTGWRKMEALTLTWNQIDWNRKLIRLEPGTTKNNDGRVFPFANYPELEELLIRQKQCTEEVEKTQLRIISWVFHRDGEAIKDFRYAWKKACAAEGLRGRWVHDLRRSAVRRMEMSGLPRSVAMRLTGHKTESIYRRYAVFSEADLEEGVAKLAGFHEVSQQKTIARMLEKPESIPR